MDEERVRQRAYEIWQREGSPEGKQEEHWAQAVQEINAENLETVAPAALDATAAQGTTDGSNLGPAADAMREVGSDIPAADNKPDPKPREQAPGAREEAGGGA